MITASRKRPRSVVVTEECVNESIRWETIKPRQPVETHSKINKRKNWWWCVVDWTIEAGSICHSRWREHKTDVISISFRFIVPLKAHISQLQGNGMLMIWHSVQRAQHTGDLPRLNSTSFNCRHIFSTVKIVKMVICRWWPRRIPVAIKFESLRLTGSKIRHDARLTWIWMWLNPHGSSN